MVESGMLVYIDMFQAPFDFQSFDNLPLSLATPPTHTDRVPKGFVKHSFSLRKDNMCYHNMAALIAKLDKHPQATVIIDSYD
jgi:hypothetical protein